MAKRPDEPRLELLQGTLDMLILRTLQWGPQHGHGIGQAIGAQSDGLLKVETGSLYPALHRLEKRGWLKSEWDVSEANAVGHGSVPSFALSPGPDSPPAPACSWRHARSGLLCAL